MDPARDPLHCGGCDSPCEAGQVCEEGACVSPCEPACGEGEVCTEGACLSLGCPEGQAACAGRCVDPTSDPSHCGACDRRCAEGEVCEGAACVCPLGRRACDGACVDVQSDPMNCGACGTVCDFGPDPKGDIFCREGACAISCDELWGDCDGAPENGCETSLAQNVENCGICGVVCGGAFSSGGTCAGGHCLLHCEEGRADCNHSPRDGCEVDLRSPASCGSCNDSCLDLYRVEEADCLEDGCAIQRCEEGWESCDGDPLSGCETQVSVDPANCGACGQSCADLPNTQIGKWSCVESRCELSCQEGWGDCNGDFKDGCEADVSQGDPKRCGAACISCAMEEVCAGGNCILDVEGANWPLPPDGPKAEDYRLSAEAVEDVHTGLMWQRLVKDLPKMDLSDAVTYCGGLVLEGRDDWRLPTTMELLTLVDMTRFHPAVDTEIFPGSASSGTFWSVTRNLYLPGNYFLVDFGFGGGRTSFAPAVKNRVRCVRGGASIATERYLEGEGSVTDTWTRLQWQAPASAAERTWAEATDECEALRLGGHEDWRLPTMKELLSLLNLAFDSRPPTARYLFPDAPATAHWSSTKGALEGVRVVNFSDGSLQISEEDAGNAARCVRSLGD